MTGVQAGTAARIVASFPGVPDTDTVRVAVVMDQFAGFWFGHYNNSDRMNDPYFESPMSLSVFGTSGTVTLDWRGGRFSGAFPASLPDPNSRYGRSAIAEYRNLNSPGAALVIEVYELTDEGPMTGAPWRLQIVLFSNGLGSRLTGTLYECYGHELHCGFGFPIVGNISLDRV